MKLCSRVRLGSRARDHFNLRLVMAAIVAAAVVAVVSLNVVDKRSAAFSGQPPVSLRLSGPFNPKYAAEIVASSANIFERNGIDCELRESDKGADPIDTVVSRANTFGVTDSISFLKARARGQPIVAFAAGFLESSIVFYALQKSGILAPQDFVGKRVGRRAVSDSAIIYDALLKNAGISRSQMRESATETDLDALLNDRVDVIPGRIGEEGHILQQMGVPYTVIRISDYGIHILDTVYFATEATLRDRPSLAVRFLQSIIAGWTMTYVDQARATPLIVAAGKDLIPEQVQFKLAAQRDFVMPLGRRIAEFDEQQWRQLRDILVNARVIDASVDLKRAVDYDILKEAYRKPISFGN